MLAGTLFHTGLGLGFLEEELDLDLRIVDFDLHLDLAVAGLVTSMGFIHLFSLVNVTFRPGWTISCTVGYFPSVGWSGLVLWLCLGT